jgi:lactoylglutathione lyase
MGVCIMSVEKRTETNVKQAVPFFGVSNVEESLRFYVHGLGFEMTKKWIDEGKLRWCWLSVCFMCEDALAIYRDTASRGIKVSRNPFVGNGLWVVSFSDPDGYRIDFESPTDVPEETEYAPQQS